MQTGRVLAMALLGAALMGVTTLTHAQPAPSTAKADDLFARINHARLQAGALPVARSAELDAAAQAHSVDMVQNTYLDHTGPDGSEPQERADKAGYHVPPQSGWIVVEVISAISGEPQGPLDWWLNDDPQIHGKVVLNPRWREVGIGYAEGGEYGHYWTAMFGCRPRVVPTVTVDGEAYATHEECGDPSVAPVAVAPTQTPVAPTLTPVLPTPTPVATLAPPRLALDTEVIQPGAAVNVRWNGLDRPMATDWIGLYRREDVDDVRPWVWVYVGCAQTVLDARALGSCTIVVPKLAGPGAYEVRLFRDNGYTRVATSSTLTVGGMST